MTVAVSKITPWISGAAPMAWAPKGIYLNKKNANGLFRAYLANPDGTYIVECVTPFPSTTHNGISDVTKDGHYGLFVAERSDHLDDNGHLVVDGDSSAIPGAGRFNDLYLVDMTRPGVFKLRDLLVTGNKALIWPRFSNKGDKIVWSEQTFVDFGFGKWNMYVANLDFTNPSAPSLKIINTIQGKGFLEPYGFTPDDSNILFASDYLAGLPWYDTQIYTTPVSSLVPRRISPITWSDWGFFGNYNEFAYIMPSNPDRVMYARTQGGKSNSLEYWSCRYADAHDLKQLTYMSVPTNEQYQGNRLNLLGGLAFNPANPKQFVIGSGTDYIGGYTSYIVDLA